MITTHVLAAPDASIHSDQFNSRFRPSAAIAIIMLLFAIPAAHATNGYFSDGYGVKAEGIAGVGIALPQDSLAAATNPAGLAWVGNRLDVGGTLFVPNRHSDITGNGAGPDSGFSGNDRELFLLPSLGYSRVIRPDLVAGIAAYGNGGLNTDYKNNPYARFGATGSAGVSLAQLFITPSIAWKINERNALGLAINLAYQRFSAKGLNAFAPFSSNPNKLTDQGNDSATGASLRLGWTGQINDQLTLGATWQSRTSMGKFDKYQGLFADGGGFDIPSTYGLGIAYQVNPQWTVAADVQRILYSKVNSVGNDVAKLFAGVPLGASNGPGFGWRDINVIKLGAQYQYSPNLILRGGISKSGQPVPANQTFFNILAPGVVELHLTLGGTWQLDKHNEISASYLHAFNKRVSGSNSIPASFGGGNANIELSEDALGLSWGHQF